MAKLCFITPSFPYMSCGVGDYTFELIKLLKSSEFKIGVVTLDHKKTRSFMRSCSDKGLTLFPIVKRWNFRNLDLLLKKIKSFRPEIIHIQYHCGSTNHGFVFKGLMIILLPLFFKLLRIGPLIVTTLHSHLEGAYLFPRAWILRRWSLAPLLFFSDRIIATNRFDQRELYKHFPFTKNKVDYIAGGTGHYLIDSGFQGKAQEAKSTLKGSEEEIVISNFGFMVPYKGIEDLLQAMHILRKEGYPLRLLAIGGFDTEFNLAGSYFDKLQKMAGELDLEPYIKWTGFCEAGQASVYFLASDICVMPFRDGASEWRSSFLDALSHGLPIVTTRTERTPPELINKVNCMLVPPGDIEALVKAVRELLASAELRRSLAKAASLLYREKFSWPVIAEKTIELYRRELKKGKGSC